MITMMTVMMAWRTRRVMSRTSTTKPSVRPKTSSTDVVDADPIALKEDNAEGALKAFRQIVDDQSEKGEWSAYRLATPTHKLTFQGL